MCLENIAHAPRIITLTPANENTQTTDGSCDVRAKVERATTNAIVLSGQTKWCRLADVSLHLIKFDQAYLYINRIYGILNLMAAACSPMRVVLHSFMKWY